MLHSSEHVLVRPVVSNTQHKVWCVALVSQLLQDAVHGIALGCALHTPTHTSMQLIQLFRGLTRLSKTFLILSRNVNVVVQAFDVLETLDLHGT